jgi:hypothetical protein
MTCPANPPAPAGYAVWRGAVPASLQKWAVELLGSSGNFPYGQTWNNIDPMGRPVIARKDYHTWHYQPDGTLLTGICWPGITLYRPVSLEQGLYGESRLVTNVENGPPDPSLAVYDNAPISIAWPTVILTGGVIAGLVGAFILAVRAAGRA